jgi:hypothetical protein
VFYTTLQKRNLELSTKRNFGVLMIERPSLGRVALSCACTALLLVSTGLIPLARSAPVAYSPPIEARVVGPDGMPLADALVVANWNIVGPWNGASRGQLALFEVTTGPDGKFSIPAWGPRSTTHGTVRAVDPTLRILKPGYRPRVIYNVEGWEQFDSAPIVIHFRLQGQDILLTPSGAPGDKDDVAAMDALSTSTITLCESFPCKLRDDLINRARQPGPVGAGASTGAPPLTPPTAGGATN